ncbi:MAG: putative DNA-binding domain-containing protein [Gammaproteobacteria bacterium]|nr:putative DNA-binding domain-containing protein [Gammaproteobacteria bacterium]
MSEHEPAFLRLQRDFARHLRDPAAAPAPAGLPERGLGVYRYAVHANIERFLADNYPRVRAVLDEAGWDRLVRDYLVRHVARASAFVDLPREFLAYLDSLWAPDPALPFLRELAHFDWLETLVGADTRRLDLDGIDAQGDLLRGVPVANPLLVQVTYVWPVHAIDTDYQPVEPPPQPTRIAAFRDRNHDYGFLDLNAASARLLDAVCANRERSGRELLILLAGELGHGGLEAFIEAGGTILARMHARDAILGTARR